MTEAVLKPIRSIPWRHAEVWCIAAWVLTMISLPIARWTWGDSVIPTMTTVSAVFQFGAVGVVLWRAWGARRTVITLVTVAVLTWGAEWIGEPQTLYVHIRWLREQIEEDAANPRRLITVRGVGYRFEG